MSTFTEHPWLWLLAFVASQVLLFFGREPLHRALGAAAQAAQGACRLIARYLRGAADALATRNREILRETARVESERKLEREVARVQEGFVKHLANYPSLHQRLEAGTARLAEDLDQCAMTPPEPPAWAEAAQAVRALPALPEKSAQRVLTELKEVAEDGHKRVLKEFRETTAQRHKILAGFSGVLKDLRQSSAQTLRAVSAALDSASRIDAHILQQQKLVAGDVSTERKIAADHLGRAIVALLIMAVALGGAFVNFQLIALPMSELVPSTTRVGGVAVAQIAALVIVLMEAAAGVFLLEGLGLTELLPRIGSMPKGHRRLITVVAFVGLLVLSCIEASLAILREQIVAADLELKQSLAGGAHAEVAAPMFSSIPVIGQAVLGLILPWLLAMIAIPLETLVASGRVVGGSLVVGAMHGVGALLRAVGWILRKTANTLSALVDLYVALPIALSKLFARRKPLSPPGPRAALHGTLSAALLALTLANSACTDGREHAQALCVLADTSGTYADQLGDVTRTLRQGVLPRLLPGDTLVVARIDDASYEKPNVTAVVTLDPRPSTANAQKQLVANRLTDLGSGHKKVRFTDISGGILLCADYLRASVSEHKAIVVFSDMREELPKGVRRELPANELSEMNLVAMNVKRLDADSKNPAAYRARLAAWEDTAKRSGAREFKVLLEPEALLDYLDEMR